MVEFGSPGQGGGFRVCLEAGLRSRLKLNTPKLATHQIQQQRPLLIIIVISVVIIIMVIVTAIEIIVNHLIRTSSRQMSLHERMTLQHRSST